ncbi:uncharacterized protein EAE98_005436 [Botrytis deweyae]|uniref:1,3-beta-glucanosyltransferase n=1 Tax=Botrytis deweyae TaxID=2478750 RepID=A0ABQ7INX6_9HELO|nr:uncharacterized protein EAE98_005436 [Botrytis deweyae]KAF7929518.1 hypothetical protein EAE98_005436 [Botrytis deweyae]
MNSRAVDSIIIKGSKFFYSNGTQFFLRGVTYGSDSLDILADRDACERDIKALVSLGINVLHVYGIDSSQDHGECMEKFMENGIYLLIDLHITSTYIYIDSTTWTNQKFSAYVDMVDAFAFYTNTLGFYLVDNPVTDSSTSLAPLSKAAVRDVKGYIKARGYRSIPIGGYVLTDSDYAQETYRLAADYMACGNSSIDFWALTDYSWCDNSTFTSSNYSRLTQSFSDYPLPIFLADYACEPTTEDNSDVAGRIFDEVGTIYGPEMSDNWSGGIVYEWARSSDSDPNDYALVNLTDNTIQLNQNYKSLSTQLAAINPSITQMSAYTPTITTAPSCPDENAAWAASTILPPTANTLLCDCMIASLHCKVDPSTSVNTITSVQATLCTSNSTICDGFTSNVTSSTYGAFSVCSPWQQVSWAINQYYLNTGGCSQKTTTASLQALEALNSSCINLLAKAGPLGKTPIYSDITIADSTSDSNITSVYSDTSTDSSRSLSGGTIAGIVVGILLALIAAGSLIFFYLRKRKSRKSHIAQELEASTPGQHDTPAELGNDGQKAELWANDTSTNTGTTSPKELAHEGDAMLPRNQNESREICEMA